MALSKKNLIFLLVLALAACTPPAGSDDESEPGSHGYVIETMDSVIYNCYLLNFFSKDAHENSMPPESSDPLFGSPSEEHPIEPDEGEGADEDAEGGMANASLSSQPSGPSRFQVHLGTRLLHKCCVELNYIALCFCFFF